MAQSMDWSHEALASTMWVVAAAALCAVLLALFLTPVVAFTAWGKRLARVGGGFFTARGCRARAWGLMALLLFETVAGVRVSVVFSYQFRDLLNAVQGGAEALALRDGGKLAQAQHMFWFSFAISAVLAVLIVLVAVVDVWAQRAFALRWRMWLNDRLLEDWLGGAAFYRDRFLENPVRNPDQRIQMDVEAITTKTTVLSVGAAKALLLAVSFSKILWQLSPKVSVFGVAVPSMVVIAYLFALAVSAAAFWIGSPLVRLNFASEGLNARYRYALVRFREAAEQVAFLRGGRSERARFDGAFAEIVANQRRIIASEVRLTGWNSALGSSTSGTLTFIVQAPRVFAGQLGTGELFQTHTAFGSLCGALEYFRGNYKEFTQLSAALLRVDEMLASNEQARALPRAAARELEAGLAVEGLTVRGADGAVLVEQLDLRLGRGGALLVKGPSGCGKTTLLRSLAGLWPHARGVCARPSGSLFLPQVPYVPLGDVRGALCYPQDSAEPDSRLREVLDKVGLACLGKCLDETQDWSAVLSPGEQQRLSLARALLAGPRAVFLDEATSALDEEFERKMYELLRAELPGAVLVSVGHRAAPALGHTSVLELLGRGRWQITDLPTVQYDRIL
ncbi:ABC transporter ATP-binding protein/permease [Segniliparus rotundus]|nr:ABC transporter ATP-binding protein/permease [Segniliparus rotundus]